ncbi:MAG: ATP-dependent protease subunit HslV [Rickettsiales bacterium]|nr:ATP-dependent protease subunit HslV [Rickettsiales bacterium]
MEEKVRSTTILCVRRGDETVIASDGQVTLGNMVAKGTAKKIRSFQKGKILAGFAGSVADCMTLLDRLEKKLDQYEDLMRSCYELAKEWRTDKYIRNLEASLIITDGKMILSMSGDGNVLEPENSNIASVGSGSVFAISAARALYENTNLSAEDIVKKAMHIAGEMCIYTNHHLSIEKINTKEKKDETAKSEPKKEGLFKKKSKKEGKKK